MVLTDQQRFDTIRALGFGHMYTPNLDRLVAEGVSFTDCHVTAPSCAPSRASLFTGQYPHTSGVFVNGDPWQNSWVETLASAGYHCVNIGKMHTGPLDTPLGFHERYIVENKDRPLASKAKRPYFEDEWDLALRARGLRKPGRQSYREREDYESSLGAFEWELAEDAHPDFFVGDLATKWIEEHAKRSTQTRPLFLQIGFPGPHPPYDPISRFAEPYLQRDLPLSTVTEAELRQQPTPLHALRQEHARSDHDACRHLLEPTREQLHRQRAFYFANITMIDQRLGQILDALEQHGYLDDAVVVFTSDHGDCLGDHGHSQKWTMYDVVTRVPLIVWSPHRFDGGRRIESLCQLMDVGATILELAGIDVPEHFEAVSLVQALNGTEGTIRRLVLAEQRGDNVLKGVDFMTMVRTQSWKLIHFTNVSDGQLFDLQSDPHERTNLWHDPAQSGTKNSLLQAMKRILGNSRHRSVEFTNE